MYSNGYVPPNATERRRRSERNTARPAAANPQAGGQEDLWQAPAQSYPCQPVGQQRQAAGQTPPQAPRYASARTPRRAEPRADAVNVKAPGAVPRESLPPYAPYANQTRAASNPRQAYSERGGGYAGRQTAYPMNTGWQGQSVPASAVMPCGNAQGYHPSKPSGDQPSLRGMYAQDTGRTGWQQEYPAGGQGAWPPQPPSGPSGFSNGFDHQGGGKPPRGTPGRTVLVVLLSLVVVICLCVGGYYALADYQVRQYVMTADTTFCQGVYVDGIHLGGMTREEGTAAVSEQAQQRSNAWSVRLTYQGQLVTEITASQLGMRVDVADVLLSAWNQGHTGDLRQRKEQMEQLLVTPYQGYTALPGGDTSVIDSILDNIKNQLYAAPRDAAVLEFDPGKTYPFTFQEEMPGRTLDTEPIKEALYRMVSTMESGDIEITPQLIQPQVTVAQLKQQLSLRATATTPISTRSTENRTNNIRRCFQSITGQIIQPGKTFSFNAIVGQRTQANGFYEAIEYAYGEEVMGWGGGSCQASTTVYQAAVLAGLQIIERDQHSAAVSYAEYGKDATVYWNGKRKIDLSFRNNTDAPIYIVAAVQSSDTNRKKLVAKVSIYGQDLGDVSYGLEAEQTEILPAPTEPKYVKDTKQQYVTYVDEEQQVSKAKDGFVIKSYRVTYQNGTEIAREELDTDRYEPKPETIYVGTKRRE